MEMTDRNKWVHRSNGGSDEMRDEEIQLQRTERRTSRSTKQKNKHVFSRKYRCRLEDEAKHMQIRALRIGQRVRRAKV